MTKESVVKGVIEIVSNAQMVGTFHDAYNNDKCYYHKGHNCYIVQTIKSMNSSVVPSTAWIPNCRQHSENSDANALQDSYTNIVCVPR